MKSSPASFLKSVLAGVSVSIGVMTYYSAESKFAGALLFSVGLFLIYLFGFDLYTGKVADLAAGKKGYGFFLLRVLLGNALGSCGAGFLVRAAAGERWIDTARHYAESKLALSPAGAFVLAVFCGMLMCGAVKGWLHAKEPFGKYFALTVCVAVFVTAGFEHSIANFFCFSLAGAWSLKALGYTALYVLGNGLGGVLIPLAMRAWGNPLPEHARENAESK